MQPLCAWREKPSPGNNMKMGGRDFRDWSDFREMILERWRTLQAGTLLDRLFSLQQTDSVREFRRRFETLTGPLRDVATLMLETAFMNELREDIRAELRLWSPIGLSQIMNTTQQIEDKNLAVQASGYGPFPWVGRPTPAGSYSTTRTIHTRPISHSQPPNLKLGTPSNSHQKPYVPPPPQPSRSHPPLSPYNF